MHHCPLLPSTCPVRYRGSSQGHRCPGAGGTVYRVPVCDLPPVRGKIMVFFINLRRKHCLLIVFGSLARQRRNGLVVVMIEYKFMIQELLIRSLSIRRHACHHLFLFRPLSTRLLVACVDTLWQITHVFYLLRRAIVDTVLGAAR